MTRKAVFLCLALLALVDRVGSARAASDPKPMSFGRLDAPRLVQADADPGQWFTNGRDAGGTYYSTLTQIDQRTIGKLGFAWQYALGTSRGLEATPIVIDGVMFTAGNFGRVYALDAATGKPLWTFVPELDNQWIRYACCDAVNRGVVVWEGRVYVGAIDGYLYALDAKSGATRWKTDTLLGRDKHLPYTITGAPVVTRDAVVIGNGGADYPGVRGYVSAYDKKTGRLKWRFFTVPRDPALGSQDQPHLDKAVTTWDPHHQWEVGGGGNVWDGLSYDPKNDLLFLGTANVSPYNTRLGGRKGGDELYAASVIAVHASSGTMAWYFQEVPDDRWDLDSTEKFILTTLTISGRSARCCCTHRRTGSSMSTTASPERFCRRRIIRTSTGPKDSTRSPTGRFQTQSPNTSNIPRWSGPRSTARILGIPCRWMPQRASSTYRRSKCPT